MLKGLYKTLRRDERGITGLETAIILIAFVVVASVFAYTVLSAGIFSSQKGQEAVYSGLSGAQSSIDLKGGNCVRLYQGKYDEETVFSEDPVEVALKWQSLGAPRLHVVDLDGAARGKICNLNIIKELAGAVLVPIQLGGGIRQLETIEQLLKAGIDRVILGTVAVENPEKVVLYTEKKLWQVPQNVQLFLHALAYRKGLLNKSVRDRVGYFLEKAKSSSRVLV
jgi:flagellin-like protein